MVVMRDWYARGVRVCTVCKQEKPADAFPIDARTADGRQARCRPCHCRAALASRPNRQRRRRLSGIVGALRGTPYFAENAVRLGTSGFYRTCVCGRTIGAHPAPGCPAFFERGR